MTLTRQMWEALLNQSRALEDQMIMRMELLRHERKFINKRIASYPEPKIEKPPEKKEEIT